MGPGPVGPRLGPVGPELGPVGTKLGPGGGHGIGPSGHGIGPSGHRIGPSHLLGVISVSDLLCLSFYCRYLAFLASDVDLSAFSSICRRHNGHT